MIHRCEVCKDGGDISVIFQDGIGWMLHCDSCGWERPCTEEEIRDILCIDENDRPIIDPTAPTLDTDTELRTQSSYEKRQRAYRGNIMQLADVARIECEKNERPAGTALQDPAGTRCENCAWRVQLAPEDPTIWECSLTMLLRWLGDPEAELAGIAQEEALQITVDEITRTFDDWTAAGKVQQLHAPTPEQLKDGTDVMR